MARTAVGRKRDAREGRELVAAWRADPVRFSRTVLRSDPWEGAERVMRAVAVPHARVCVFGAHAMAKSRTAAEIVLWALCCGFKVVTTSARFEQVKRNVWAEVHGLVRSMAIPLGVEPNQTEIEIVPGVFAVGWSTNDETRFQGTHGKRVLYVVDEAAGVDDRISRAIDGSRASGDVRELHLGNPSNPVGAFFEASRSPQWTAIRLDAFDSPNMRHVRCKSAGVEGEGRTVELADMTDEDFAAPEASVRPYLAGPRWARSMLEKYGPTSAVWQWKVRGMFPQQSADALILEALIRGQVDREPEESDEVEVGIDVAGPGEDEHVIAVRRGPRLLSLHPMQGRELAESTGEDARDELARATLSVLAAIRPSVVKIDEIGIGGYLCTIVRNAGYEVEGVNVSRRCESDEDQRRFANEKARIAWSLRERFQERRVCGVDDPLTREQLSQIGWRESATTGKTEVVGKDEMRERGVGSPDRAEAVILAFAPRAVKAGKDLRSWLV